MALTPSRNSKSPVKRRRPALKSKRGRRKVAPAALLPLQPSEAPPPKADWLGRWAKDLSYGASLDFARWALKEAAGPLLALLVGASAMLGSPKTKVPPSIGPFDTKVYPAKTPT